MGRGVCIVPIQLLVFTQPDRTTGWNNIQFDQGIQQTAGWKRTTLWDSSLLGKNYRKLLDLARTELNDHSRRSSSSSLFALSCCLSQLAFSLAASSSDSDSLSSCWFVVVSRVIISSSLLSLASSSSKSSPCLHHCLGARSSVWQIVWKLVNTVSIEGFVLRKEPCLEPVTDNGIPHPLTDASE